MRKIKSISRVLITLLCVVCVSCGDDNEEPVNPEWNAVESNRDGSGTDNPTVVDLGLSVKWATCNLGADIPEDIGDYYAWGETSTKNEYTDVTYFDSNYSIYTISGKKNICGTDRDAAYVNLGSDWRMPTESEVCELIEGCSWQEEVVNGVKGMKGTATNGNTIFLPITGMFAGSSVQSQSQGCYWTGELAYDSSYSNRYASMLTFFSGGDVSSSKYYRFEGMAIRPVYIGSDIGGNEQEPTDSEDTPEDNLPADSKNFVGYWLNSSFSQYRPNLYFSADGICLVMTESMDKKYDYDYTWYKHVYSGYWAYDGGTKILATTVGAWQFNVTLSNEWAWSGIFKRGDDSYNESWGRASNLDVAKILIEWVKWKDVENTSVSLSKYTLTEDNNEDDYVFNYVNGSETGTVTIRNPFYLSKSSLVFTGSRNETLYW
ncbi:MAG: hypothetical protein IJY31_06645 [Muribaculaceae bacterium]|nr:hypothetical protein [Muribaculaceae bacterium]